MLKIKTSDIPSPKVFDLAESKSCFQTRIWPNLILDFNLDSAKSKHFNNLNPKDLSCLYTIQVYK